jgi:hypothetical protein
MYHKNQYINVSFIKILLVCTSLLWLGIGCDDLLPPEFKAKDFNPSNLDIEASNLFTRDTINDSQGVTTGYRRASTRYIVNSQALAGLNFVDSTTRADSTDNQIILSKFNILADSLDPVVIDSLLYVTYPANLMTYPINQRATYAVLKILPGQSKDIYIYTSLYYYSGNSNDYVNIELVKRDTSLVSSSSRTKFANTYFSTITVLVNQTEKVLPTIRERFKLHLEEGVYLVRFNLSNPATISYPSIPNEFKVIILSI